MRILEKNTNGKTELEFRDFGHDVNYQEIIDACKMKNIIVTEKQLIESHEDWLGDLKSSIELPGKYFLYHPCGCNPLYFSFFFDPEYYAYKC